MKPAKFFSIVLVTFPEIGQASGNAGLLQVQYGGGNREQNYIPFQRSMRF